MRDYKLFIFLLLVGALSVRYLIAAPAIGAVSSTPTVIPANTSTNVTVTAQITDPGLIPTSVNLLQGPPGNQSIAGSLHDDGTGRHIYTITESFNLPQGQIQLYVSAAFAGALRRVVSPVLLILVVTTPTSSGFMVDTGALAVGGPLSLNNFGSAYTEGGAIPDGGAMINVTSIPLPTPPLSNFISTIELAGATITSTSSLTVAGISCTQVFFTDTFGADLTYNGDGVYCPSGTILYKFYLQYISGDPNASHYLATFQQVLNGATLPH